MYIFVMVYKILDEEVVKWCKFLKFIEFSIMIFIVMLWCRFKFKVFWEFGIFILILIFEDVYVFEVDIFVNVYVL